MAGFKLKQGEEPDGEKEARRIF